MSEFDLNTSCTYYYSYNFKTFSKIKHKSKENYYHSLFFFDKRRRNRDLKQNYIQIKQRITK